MLFRKLRDKAAERMELPQLEPVDHSLAEAAIESAVDTHLAAQEQIHEAKKVVSELRQVNIRNGFAPAIAASIQYRNGGTQWRPST